MWFRFFSLFSILFGVFFILPVNFLSVGAQPTVTESDTQIVPSAGFKALWPDEGVCRINLEQLANVHGPFTAGQCVVASSPTTFVGGQCGGGGTGLTEAQREDLQGAVQFDSVSLSDTDITLASSDGQVKSLDLENVFTEINPVTIRDKLAGLSGNDRLDASAIKNIPSARTHIGSNQSFSFGIPATTSNVTLRSATVNTRVYHHLPSFTGAGISGVLTQSAVNSVGRVTVGQAGFVNLSFEDEITIHSSTAGTSGNSGELVYVLKHYSSSDMPIRSWVGEHTIEDAISHAVTFPISMSIGLTPVESGDYFTLNYAFSSSRAGDNVVFSLPADNADLDERLEVFFWPVTSVVSTGPRGPPGPPGPQGPAGPAGSGGSGGDSDSRLIALPSVPTDLSSYSQGQILPLNAPIKGKWVEVKGADAGEKHSFRVDFEADSSNPARASWQVGTDLNYGYSSPSGIFSETSTQLTGARL